ncbi:hypothetical protein ACFPC0_10560 [Streptomyces andamanensis]|uniref:SAV-6107-like HEPN domain-containing protein n=1 Tax=Streptomyces andamanensis TaxID=1565035 RepID=A0ABV8TCC7_9ACTN
MGVSLIRQPRPPGQPADGTRLLVHLCALHGQSLRRRAETASPLQAERALTEYGAAAALEQAAQHWADGDIRAARAWMAAAENALSAALLPVPWRQQ